MEQKDRVLPRFALAIVLLLAAAMLFGGTAYARYRSVQERALAFETEAEGRLRIDNNRLETDNGPWSNSFTVTNESEETLRFSLRTAVSLGIGGQDNAVLVLDDGQTEHIGAGETIPEGSFLYDSFGPGWLYDYGEAKYTLEAGEERDFTVRISPANTGIAFPADSKVQTELIMEH